MFNTSRAIFVAVATRSRSTVIEMSGTGKKGDTKRQHYVPQLLLRSFSTNGRQVSLWSFAHERQVDGAPIKSQCSRDYFYGDDQLVENGFSRDEAAWASILRNVAPNALAQLDVGSLDSLRAFVHFQHFRTVAAAERAAALTQLATGRKIQKAVKVELGGDVRSEDVDRLDLRPDSPIDESLWAATKLLPIMSDLQIKFVCADGTRRFVLGDHPSVQYNAFVEGHEQLRHVPASIGLSHKGLQMFMPISPTVTVALYDGAVYSYGDKGLRCCATDADVATLNSLQAVNAMECVYFLEGSVSVVELSELTAVRRSLPSPHRAVDHSNDIFPDGDESSATRVAVGHAVVRMGVDLSFVRTHDAGDYDPRHGIPVRSPELVAATLRRASKLDAQVVGRREQDDC